MKLTRSDFLKDVKQPLKQRGARLFSDQFFFVTPPGLLKPEEIPDWAGLLEPYADSFFSNWATWNVVVPAPIRSKDAPSWPLVVSMLRREAIILHEGRSMPIVFRQWITPFYVFGDNGRRIGFGGQAKEMRGQPNAIGVATKWEPSNRPNAFFSDTMVCRTQVERDLIQVQRQLERRKTVVVPLTA
jgi:hypothetical protein